ncbi:MAG: UDP-N-acetylmuramoyl-L-alanine--D-glutamate ligase [Saprospiraceae bacterium]|nr:UDP-N-acetylmuramoyl-L-alanine--D-glutamate ligase [Saprospiraceae bacterium]
MKVVIIGAKESGVGAALLCLRMHYEVLVSDSGPIVNPFRTDLERSHIPFEENGHSGNFAERFDLMVLSPGVPTTVPVVAEFIKSGKEVISEIEFAWRHIGNGKVIGITGTNGKTTLSSLIYHVLEEMDADVTLVGNIGFSFAKMISTARSEYYVCELSSFQLETIVKFKPHVAIITNITPDHLDRYDHSMAKYAAAKFRITENQTEKDLLVLNADDEETMTFFKDYTTRAQVHVVESSRITENSYTSASGKHYDLSGSQLRGRHNRANMAQAIEALEFIGIGINKIEENISTFKGLAHRMEYVATVKGVDFINDSKATNVDSVWYALEAMTRPVIWIAGGTDKGNDYEAIKPLVSSKVKHLVCLGLDNAKLLNSFGDVVDGIEEARSAEEAVKKALEAATSGDVVLLSPACASFDLFNNYEDRGEKFKKAIRKLL